MTEKPARKRRWFQFSLRTLLIVVVLLSLPLGWLGIVAERTRQQKKILENFYECGTDAEFRLGYVVTLYIFESRDGIRGPYDEELAHLKGLSKLDQLYINSADVTDAGLQYIGRLTTLKSLFVDRAAITDHGLEYLKSLVNLRVLLLEQTAVTDQGVLGLQKALPNCTVIKDGQFHHTGDYVRDTSDNKPDQP